MGEERDTKTNRMIPGPVTHCKIYEYTLYSIVNTSKTASR
jgi:hypothetical protein